MNYEIISDKARQQWVRARNYMQQASPGIDFIIQPFIMVCEILLDAAKDNYKLDFFQGNTVNLRPTENRLNRNDLLFANAFQVAVYKQNVTASLANYNYPVFTYPDANYFNGNDGTNLPEWQALMTIWGGYIDLVTAPVKRVETLNLSNNLYVPRQQVLESAFVGITNETLPAWGPTEAERGFVDLGYSYIIDGSEDNSATIYLGPGNRSQIAGLVDASNVAVTTRNVLRLSMSGYKVNNGAQKVGRWTNV